MKGFSPVQWEHVAASASRLDGACPRGRQEAESQSVPPRDRKAFDAKRRAEKPWRAWYTTPRWSALRKHQLLVQPLCERCLASKPPRLTIATVVHHLTPHRGNETKFWSGPFASSCKPCHDRIEQGIEARGYDTATDENGFPVDPSHPFNR